MGGMKMELTVYLAGQIHDDWREEVARKAKEKKSSTAFRRPTDKPRPFRQYW